MQPLIWEGLRVFLRPYLRTKTFVSFRLALRFGRSTLVCRQQTSLLLNYQTHRNSLELRKVLQVISLQRIRNRPQQPSELCRSNQGRVSLGRH